MWRIASQQGVSIGLRVNPEISNSSHDIYNPCQPGSRFGITADHLGSALPREVEGFHFHTLFEADSFALERVLAAFIKKFGKYLPKLRWMNMGGGHLITKKGYDINHLVKILTDFKNTLRCPNYLRTRQRFYLSNGLPGFYGIRYC